MLILIWTQCNTIHFCSTFCASIPEHFLIKLKLALNNLQIPKRFIKKKKKIKTTKNPTNWQRECRSSCSQFKIKRGRGANCLLCQSKRMRWFKVLLSSKLGVWLSRQSSALHWLVGQNEFQECCEWPGGGRWSNTRGGYQISLYVRIVLTFAASDKEWGRHTVLCDTWPQSSLRKTVGQINK